MSVYLFDTREKKNNHIKRYFDEHGIEYKEVKLDVGDYMLEGGRTSVDRKQNLDEVAHNLLNRSDKARFWREVRRARENGIKMIVLCEHSSQIKSIPDVAKWKSKYTKISGSRLAAEIYRIHIAYGVEFLFCGKQSTAKKIIEILSENT